MTTALKKTGSIFICILLLALLIGSRSYALDAGTVMKLCLSENDVKIELINDLVWRKDL